MIIRNALSGPEWSNLLSLASVLSWLKDKTMISTLIEKTASRMHSDYGKLLIKILDELSDPSSKEVPNQLTIATAVDKYEVDNKELVIDDIKYIFSKI